MPSGLSGPSSVRDMVSGSSNAPLVSERVEEDDGLLVADGITGVNRGANAAKRCGARRDEHVRREERSEGEWKHGGWYESGTNVLYNDRRRKSEKLRYRSSVRRASGLGGAFPASAARWK